MRNSVKKRISWGSCGPHSNGVKKAEALSFDNYKEICRRNSALDLQLAAKGLSTTDVVGDGNCLYRAASLALYSNESHHLLLRDKVATHIENEGSIMGTLIDISPDDGANWSEHVAALRCNGTAVGEDAIIALAKVCGKDVHIHISGVATQIYKSDDSLHNNDFIELAFYEPGHFKVVVNNTCTHVIDNANNLN